MSLLELERRRERKQTRLFFAGVAAFVVLAGFGANSAAKAVNAEKAHYCGVMAKYRRTSADSMRYELRCEVK